MVKEIVLSDNAPRPIGPYCQGVLVGDFLFTSGQIGLDPDTGELVSPLVSEQTRKALDNLAQVLKARRLSLRDVVKTTVYLSDMKDFPELNRVYGEFFREQPPARTTVGVSSLPMNARVEIEAIALARA